MTNRAKQTRHTKDNPVDPLDYFNPVYQYSSKYKDWMFLGYKCIKCGHIYKKDNTLDSHLKLCRGIKVNYKNMSFDFDENQPTIISKNRKVWQPYDFNQNLSNKKN